MMTEVLQKARQIKLIIFDVDGVLTDGRLYFGPAGEEYKIFHVHDGLGIKLLQQSGVSVAILSSRESPVVTTRMQSLGIKHIYQRQEDKTKAFEELLMIFNLQTQQVAYVGDDLPDLPLIQQAGLGICVANAQPLLKKYADWQTQLEGGSGAAREICEFIMAAQGTLQKSYEKYLNAGNK